MSDDWHAAAEDEPIEGELVFAEELIDLDRGRSDAASNLLSDALARVVIEQSVAQVFGVAGGDLRRATRGRAKVARARQVAMYLAHVACGMSLTDVGRLFSRDRTTVSHACSVVEDGRDDATFDRVLELLELAVVSLLRPRGSGRHHLQGWLMQ